jgi:hypothetical protein
LSQIFLDEAAEVVDASQAERFRFAEAKFGLSLKVAKKQRLRLIESKGCNSVKNFDA